MTLVIAPLNTELKVIKILTDEKVKRHLESLGITINSKIMVVLHNGGNIVVQVKDSKLALDQNIATKIIVA